MTWEWEYALLGWERKEKEFLKQMGCKEHLI
jgi:hypothetical protein